MREIFPNAIKIMGVYSESPKRPVNIQGIDKKYFRKKHQFACVYFHLKLQHDYFPLRFGNKSVMVEQLFDSVMVELSFICEQYLNFRGDASPNES